MTSILSKINPAWVLRLGLAAMYAFSGYDIWKNPDSWTWAIRLLPQWMKVLINDNIGVYNYLKIQAAGEIILAAVFLAWFLPRKIVRWVALLAAAEMVLILWLVGVDAITFRDLGVLGAALALAAFYSR